VDLPDYMKGWTPSSGIPEGLFDGAKTLAEAAQRLRDYAGDLESLAESDLGDDLASAG